MLPRLASLLPDSRFYHPQLLTQGHKTAAEHITNNICHFQLRDPEWLQERSLNSAIKKELRSQDLCLLGFEMSFLATDTAITLSNAPWYGLGCVPHNQHPYVGVLTPSASNETAFEDGVSKEVIKLE